MKRKEKDALNLMLLAMGCALLMLLPLVTTFDDLLTSWALQLGANNPLQSIVPVEARMVVSLLGLVGVRAAAAGSDIVVWDGVGSMHTLFISWNCIGWQSLILLGMTFFSGLRGRQEVGSRLQVIVIGVCGTMLLNLARVATVATLEATWGHLPALIFHDYGGTILVIGWLFVFWTAVQRWILVTPASDEMQTVIS
jgi:exosortase/archaeosortase family protein